MDTKQKYMTAIAPNKVTLSINFITQLEQCKEVRWRDIVDMVEFMDNRIRKTTHLCHVFQDEGIFIQFKVRLRPKREYEFVSMKIVDSDTYLDAILDGTSITLNLHKLRNAK